MMLGLCVPCLKLCARDLSSMYDTTTLEQRAPHYRDTTNKILNEFVYKYLTSEEKRRLAGIPIDYPLAADPPMKGDPLAFYGPPDHSRVVFPIFSIKFLDDLSTAYAWLQVNGYVLDTITEYTAMLAHKDLGARYPAPLPALHIPADALRDDKVDELALDHFVTARMFILLHELGHIYYGHEGSSIAHEVQADQFAINVMHRSPVPPLGALIYFMAEASMADYPATARTHPLSGARMQALGVAMQDPQIAMVLGDLGKLVDDPDVRASHVLTARATNLQSLTPRRGKVPMLTARAGGSLLFQGRCSGRLIQQTNPREPMKMEMVLERTGDTVRGKFSVGLGVATVEGTADGSTLNLDWQWANNYGRGTLRATDNGARLVGEWGYRESNRGGGTWSCHRVE
jgi:hypothetical protein